MFSAEGLHFSALVGTMLPSLTTGLLRVVCLIKYNLFAKQHNTSYSISRLNAVHICTSCLPLTGRKEIVQILLDAGMDPNFFEQTTGKFVAPLSYYIHNHREGLTDKSTYLHSSITY